MQPKKRSAADDNFIVAWGVYGALGFQLAAMVIGGLLLGHWIDRRFGTVPWFTLAGLIIGSIGGFFNLIRIARWREERKS